MRKVTILYLCSSCDTIGLHNTNYDETATKDSISYQLWKELKKVTCGNCKAPSYELKHQDAVLTDELGDYYHYYVKKYTAIEQINI